MQDVQEVAETDRTTAKLGAARLAFYTPVRDYPPMADRKAGAILAADGLMLSVLLLFRLRFEAIIRGPSLVATYLVLFLIACLAVVLLRGASCAYRTLTMPIPSMPHSLAFFADIAKFGLDDYRAKLLSLSERDVVRSILDYNYSLADLSVRKFALVRRATSCVRAGFFFWVALILAVMIPG